MKLLSTTAAALAALAAACALPTGAGAQQGTADALSAALARVEPGTTLRVRLRGAPAVQGEFGGVDAGALVLTGGPSPVRVPAADVEGVWTRGRQTRRGAVVGGLAGGLAALGYTGLLGLALASESNDDVGSLVLGATLAGAAGGALVGGTVGAALPRWRQVYPADPDVRYAFPEVAGRVDGGSAPGARQADPAAAPIGVAIVGVGYGRLGGSADSDGGIGARAGIFAHLGRDGEGMLVAVGPELEYQPVGVTPPRMEVTPELDCTAPGACTVVGEDTAFVRTRYAAGTARLVARVQPERGTVRPFALAGVGVHGWRYTRFATSGAQPAGAEYASWYAHPGYTLGAGVQTRLSGGTELGLEVRRSGVVVGDDQFPASYWTASLTAALAL